MKRYHFILTLFAALLILNTPAYYPHCDTMEGPVVKDAKKAIELKNINIVLKWVRAEDEAGLTKAFDKTMKVRTASQDAMELADLYFFETLVRLHRSGEGVGYTGVKPEGTKIDERILAADNAIETGDLSPLEKLVPPENIPELKKRFDKVIQLSKYDINDVKAGREYIEAYVQFFHFAEGETEAHAHQAEKEAHPHSLDSSADHASHIPWILSGLFFLTTLIFGSLLIRSKRIRAKQ